MKRSPDRKIFGAATLAAMAGAVLMTAATAVTPAVAEAPAPTPAMLVAPGSGTVRALVVGVDRYRAVPALRGAAADARDIDAALHRMGASDVTSLIDEAVTRTSVLRQLDGLVSRSQRGDLVLITLAGHGAKEDERVKGSSRDGSDEVFLMANFDPKSGPGGSEKILNHEFHHYIKEIEARGAQVVFVADTCYGGGMAREVPIGAPSVSYRQVHYRLAADDLKPVSTPAEAFLTELDFDRTAFLAAVDSDTKAPEVLIDGAYRGALSYAMARAIEGAADEKHDGRITLRELFDYTRRVVYQMSDERQTIVALQSPSRDIDRDVVLQVATRSLGSPATASVPPSAAVAPLHPLVAVPPPTPVVPAPATPSPVAAIRAPVRLASLTGRKSALAGLPPLLTPFEIVDVDDAPDVIWDPVSREAYGGYDKVAIDIAAEDLPGVVDRTAAVRDLKALVVKSPLDMRLLPDAALHRQGSRVEVAIANAAGSNLVLVDVTGVGKVQLLYPLDGPPAPLARGDFRVPFTVRDPYGADEVLAITSKSSLNALADSIRQIDDRRSAARLADVIGRFAPSDARLGLVGLFTVP